MKKILFCYTCLTWTLLLPLRCIAWSIRIYHEYETGYRWEEKDLISYVGRKYSDRWIEIKNDDQETFLKFHHYMMHHFPLCEFMYNKTMVPWYCEPLIRLWVKNNIEHLLYQNKLESKSFHAVVS